MSLWDVEAPFYRLIRHLPGLRRVLAAERQGLRTLLSELRLHGHVVLDVGCGDGESLRLIEAPCVRVGVDRSCRFAARTRRLTRVMTVVAESAALPCRSTSIDLVLCIGLLEYSRHLSATLAELVRVTRPGGHLLLTCSPAGLMTTARRLLGHAMTPMTDETLIARCEPFGLQVCAQQRLRSQHQALLRKL